MIKLSLTWGLPRYADSLHSWFVSGSLSGRTLSGERHHDASLCLLGLELKAQLVHGRREKPHPAARKRRR